MSSSTRTYGPRLKCNLVLPVLALCLSNSVAFHVLHRIPAELIDRRRRFLTSLPPRAFLPKPFPRRILQQSIKYVMAQDDSSAVTEMSSWSVEATIEFLQDWAQKRNVTLNTSGEFDDLTGKELFDLSPRHLSFLIQKSARSSVFQELYDLLHASADSGHDVALWSPSKVLSYLQDFAAKNNSILESFETPLTGASLFSISVDRMSEVFVNKDQKAGLELYYEIHPTEDTGNYYGVDLSKMSRKQLSHWLVDVANEGSLRLTPAAFQKDGSFFLETSEDVWAESLFGCTRDKCGYVLDKIRSELERNEPSELDVDLLKKTFSASYMDPLNVVGQFISYVEECGERYRKFPGTFFAPYIALFQSSGSGKSRLLREVSRLRSTLYVCCRSGNSGYPLRTSTALQFLFGPLKSKTHEEGLKEMVERLRCAETAARYYLPRAASFPEYDASQAEFPSEQLSNRIWGVDVERSKTKFGVDLDSNSDDAVLIVLDEARWLLDTRASGKWFDANAFRFFRRAIRSYWGKYPDSRLFAVFVDTSSRINNFAPSQAMDPSARQSKEGGGELFRPFILSESFDAYFNQYKLPKGTRDLTPLMTSKNHLFAGRPLVAIPFSDPESHLDFLVRKLYGGGKARLSENTLGALSVVLCRLATSVNNLSPTAAELVAGHMVYLLATDWQREEMSVSHLAEPRLALAAAREWSNEDVLIDLLIPALRGALLSGKVNPGLRGEIVAQIVILLAFDKACVLAGKAKGDVVSLVSVLEQLLPVDSNIDVHEAIPPSLHDASVSCGQFVQLDHYFDLDTNVRLAERHCGASFKGWQPGVDLVITILAKFAALLLFQVKNNYDQDKPCKASYDCANSMMPSNALSGRRISGTELRALDENCVRVYMQVGAKEGPAFCGHGPVSAGAAKPLQIFGLSSRCLTKKQKRSLEILLDATGSLESKFWEQKSQLNTLKRKHPFPNDIATLRLCMPFVLDQSPHWSDYTRKVLLSVCRKLGRRGVSNLSKHAIVTILESEQPGKCVELCEGSPHLISQLEDSIEDDLADASVAGVASSMSDAELTQPAASPKDSVLVNLGQLDRLSVAELKELCKKLGGSKYSRLRKTDLIQKLTQEWPAILRSNDGLQS